MDILLSPREYKLLRKVRFIPGVFSEYGKSDQDIFRHLAELKLIDSNLDFLMITELGLAVLHQKRQSTLKTWVPIIISTISLIVAIAAYMKK